MSVFEFTITASPEMVDLEEYLAYLVSERTSEWEAKMPGRDEDYRKALAELDGCYQNLRQLPGDAVQKEAIIERLQLVIGDLERLEQKQIYKQGLKDGARLRNFLEARS